MTNMPPNTLIEQLPHRRMEAWKWTDVRRAVGDAPSGMTSACTPKFEHSPGLSVTREPVKPSDTPMGKLAASFGGDAYVINVPVGYDGYVNISNLQNGHARIVIKLGEHANLTVEEIHSSSIGGFTNLETRFELGQYAQLTRNIYHMDESIETTRIVTTNINAWEAADFAQNTLSFGSALTRFETRVAALGVGVGANIQGAYLLNGKRHCDMTSYIDLGTESARIRQGIKGFVTDKARGVFQGKFHVRRPAQYTDAEMRHDAIMLSETCEVRAKPELEIYADDVACAHGNTVGALDESALFYMRQRGIPIAEAKVLLLQAFVLEVFDSIGDENTKHWFGNHIEDWLDEQLLGEYVHEL